MAPSEQPAQEHQVGITNAQEANPDPEISRLTREMNALFTVNRYAEASRLAMQITARSKDELREIFTRHGVTILSLDHEAFGLYAGQIEPSYHLCVDGVSAVVLKAAMEFGLRHAQEAVLIARKLGVAEEDPGQCLGLVLSFQEVLTIDQAVLIATILRAVGIAGATFAIRRGEAFIYQTPDLGMTRTQFEDAAVVLAARLRGVYPQVAYRVQPYLVIMPKR